MELNRQILRLVFGVAALSLGLMACHGSPSGGTAYMPASTGASAGGANFGVTPAREERGEVTSTCGKHIHIVVAGFVRCRFWDAGYGHAKFTLDDHTNGLILISPKTGGRHTPFTITGVLVGSGYFIAKDNFGHSLKVTVVVSL
jgi:hypothetical protein